jgi:hypothetical protein
MGSWSVEDAASNMNLPNDTDLMYQNYEKIFEMIGKTSHREEILEY